MPNARSHIIKQANTGNHVKKFNYRVGNKIQGFFCICLILTFLVSSIVIVPLKVRGNADQDLNGLYKNYNTDNSMESWISYDYNDDYIWKVFYISDIEWDESQYVHLWIFGESFGVPHYNNQGYSHSILLFNEMYPNGLSIGTFYSFEKFDTDHYQWQRFELSKSYFKTASWNRIEIKDMDPTIEQEQVFGWLINNLRIGIDQTFQNIDDFDQSYWYSGGAGVTPNDPREINGELMMALEFVDVIHDDYFFPTLQSSWDSEYSSGDYSWILIDQSDDKAYWRVDISSTDKSSSSYARLYIYAYSWTSQPLSETSMNVQLNGLNSYDFYPKKDFSLCWPIGAWSWIDIDIDDFQTGTNEFYFTDSTGYQHTNLGIIKFNDYDSGHSRWKYCDGSDGIYHGNLDYDLDVGELGIYLVLFHNEQALNMDRTVYTLQISDDWGNPPLQPYKNYDTWLEPDADVLGDSLQAANGWTRYENIQHDYTNPGAYQGQIYDENSYSRGDATDLIIVSGHGTYGQYGLQLLWDPTQDADAWTDQTSFDVINHIGWNEGYTEADFWKYGSSYQTEGEDGFNFNTDWIVFLSCDLLGKNPHIFDADSEYQTLLLHNLHTIMGYYGLFSMDYGDMLGFICDFYDRLVDGGEENAHTIINAFSETSAEYNEPWAYFTYENHVGDYLWDQGYVSSDRDSLIDTKFENKEGQIVSDSA